MTPALMQVRAAVPADAAVIASIYNQGIEDGIATFETRPRTVSDVVAWFDAVHPIVVVTTADRVIAFAATFAYRMRECYRGVAEVSLYVDRAWRRRGAGRLALAALIDAAERAGFWKLVSRVFPENIASRRLITALGFREVGVYEKHGKLAGVWRDVVIVERLIPSNLG
jgi:L-amino acid N-acyltransferase YncA